MEYTCPSCGGKIELLDTWVLSNGKMIDINRWECNKCFRIWGIETSKPVTEL